MLLRYKQPRFQGWKLRGAEIKTWPANARVFTPPPLPPQKKTKKKREQYVIKCCQDKARNIQPLLLLLLTFCLLLPPDITIMASLWRRHQLIFTPDILKRVWQGVHDSSVLCVIVLYCHFKILKWNKINDIFSHFRFSGMKGKGDVVRSFTLFCPKSLIIKLIRTNCTHKESLNTFKFFFVFAWTFTITDARV